MAKSDLANRRLKWTAGVVAIIFITLIVSVITYYYQQGRVGENKVILEIVELDENSVVVRNAGNMEAMNLDSIPPAIFDPPSIASGEESIGQFTTPLSGFTIITVTSDNGGTVGENYGESPIS